MYVYLVMQADYSADGFGLELRENGWKRLLKEIVIRFEIRILCVYW